MDLTKDAIMQIETTAVKAAGVSVVKPGAEPAHVYFLAKPDGSIEQREAEPAPIAAVLADLPAAIAVAKAWAGEADTDVAVWYSRDQVVVLRQQLIRRDRATLTLRKSATFKAICELDDADDEPMSQKDFIWLLRSKMPNALLRNHPNFITTLRQIKASSGGESLGDVQHGRESLGRSVNASVTATGDLPEVLMLTTPVYVDPEIDHNELTIACTLKIEPAEVKFALVPQPDAVELAAQAAEKFVGDYLSSELGAIPVFHGVP